MACIRTFDQPLYTTSLPLYKSVVRVFIVEKIYSSPNSNIYLDLEVDNNSVEHVLL